MKGFKGAIFDLDGVLVDTAKYHYAAWKEVARGLGYNFTIDQNEQLKGVSRMASMEIVVQLSGKRLSKEQKEQLAAEKNERYVALISKITPEELLPGAFGLLERLKRKGILLALGSASKNARPILAQTGIEGYFDTIIDGTKVSRAKPDPEVFLKGAEALSLVPADCIVFEDAAAGVAAAKAGGMYIIGVGSVDILHEANMVVRGLDDPRIVPLFLTSRGNALNAELLNGLSEY